MQDPVNSAGYENDLILSARQLSTISTVDKCTSLQTLLILLPDDRNADTFTADLILAMSQVSVLTRWALAWN